MTEQTLNEYPLQGNKSSPHGSHSLSVSKLTNNIDGQKEVEECKEEKEDREEYLNSQVKQKKHKKDKSQSKSKDKKKSKHKKTQHRCIMCKLSGKKTEMKKCTVCKHYSHLQCLNQELLPQEIKYVCMKCSCHEEFQKNKAEIKLKKREQKSELKRANKKKQEKNKKRQQILHLFKKFKSKYPYYVIQDKQIKFPIEDLLFLTYQQLFLVPELKLNAISHPTIPSKYLGDLLFIENFMITYGQDLDANYNWSGCKSKIYNIMNCQGSDRVFETLLGAIIKIYLNDIFFKNKTENIKILHENPFFTLLGLLNEGGFLTTDYLSMASRQVLRQISNIPSMKNSFNNFQFPNQLNFHTKSQLIITLINGLSEVDRFHDMVGKKSEKISQLTKDRTDCFLKLKTSEVQALINKQKLKEMTEKENQEEKIPDMNENNNSISISKNIKKKKSQELTKTGEISQRIIKDIKFKIQNITKQIPFVVSQIIYLGKDRNQSFYYFNFREPNRVYIRIKDYRTDQSQNYKYIETKQNILQLTKSLNLKGVHQRRLFDTINNLIKEQILRNLTEEEIKQQNQCQVTLPKGECVFILDENQFRKIIIKDVLDIQEKFSKYLALKNYQWSSQEKRQQFRLGFPFIQTKQALKQQIRILHQNFLFAKVMKKQSKKLESDSNQVVEPMNQKQMQSVMKNKFIRLWGINSEKTKKYWSDYLQSTVNYTGLWICVNILKSYTSRYIIKKLQNMKEEERKLKLKKVISEKKMKELQDSQVSEQEKPRNKSKGKSRGKGRGKSKGKKVGRKSIPPSKSGVKTRRSVVISKIKDQSDSSESKQDQQDEQYKVDSS